MQIEIHCPYHAKTEKIELPDEYFKFDGEIACETPHDDPKGVRLLRIKLEGGKPVVVERSSLSPQS